MDKQTDPKTSSLAKLIAVGFACFLIGAVVMAANGDGDKVDKLESDLDHAQTEWQRTSQQLTEANKTLEKYADLIALEEAKDATQQEAEQQAREEELARIEAEQAAAEAARLAEEEANKWEDVFVFEGSTEKRSEPFTISSKEAKVIWQHNGSGHFSINLVPAGDDYGDLLINQIGATSDESYVYQSGGYYLEISGSSPWTVTVVQNKNK